MKLFQCGSLVESNSGRLNPWYKRSILMPKPQVNSFLSSLFAKCGIVKSPPTYQTRYKNNSKNLQFWFTQILSNVMCLSGLSRVKSINLFLFFTLRLFSFLFRVIFSLFTKITKLCLFLLWIPPAFRDRVL